MNKAMNYYFHSNNRPAIKGKDIVSIVCYVLIIAAMAAYVTLHYAEGHIYSHNWWAYVVFMLLSCLPLALKLLSLRLGED